MQWVQGHAWLEDQGEVLIIERLTMTLEHLWVHTQESELEMLRSVRASLGGLHAYLEKVTEVSVRT